jgi:hypothetical protein
MTKQVALRLYFFKIGLTIVLKFSKPSSKVKATAFLGNL